MRSRKSRQPIWNLWNFSRVALITALIVATTGTIAYAVLLSKLGTVKGNTIETSVANLLVSSDGTNFSSSLNGYYFGGLIPGGQPMPTNGYQIYLKNTGTTPLTANLRIPAGFSNPDNLDLTKTHLILTPIAGGAAQNYTLQALIDAAANGGVPLTGTLGHIALNQVYGYTMQIQLESDAINGPSALLTNLEFDFGGVAN